MIHKRLTHLVQELPPEESQSLKTYAKDLTYNDEVLPLGTVDQSIADLLFNLDELRSYLLGLQYQRHQQTLDQVQPKKVIPPAPPLDFQLSDFD